MLKVNFFSHLTFEPKKLSIQRGTWRKRAFTRISLQSTTLSTRVESTSSLFLISWQAAPSIASTTHYYVVFQSFSPTGPYIICLELVKTASRHLNSVVFISDLFSEGSVTRVCEWAKRHNHREKNFTTHLSSSRTYNTSSRTWKNPWKMIVTSSA